MKPTLRLASSSDTGRSASDLITRDTTPILFGMADVGSTVRIFDGGVEIGQSTTSLSGWTFQVPELASGVHTFTIEVTSAAGVVQTAGALNVTIDTSTVMPTIDLSAASDLGFSNTDNLTRAGALVFTGTGEVGAVIEIMDGTKILGATTVKADGSWRFNATSLGEGSHQLTAVATDRAGNTVMSSPLDVVIDRTLAVPTLTLAAGHDTGVSDSDGVTNDRSPTFRVTTEAGAIVAMRINGQEVQTVIADENGEALFSFSNLTDGAYSFSARVTDLSGNAATTETRRLLIDTVGRAPSLNLVTDTGVSGSDNITSIRQPDLNGRAERGGSSRFSAAATRSAGSSRTVSPGPGASPSRPTCLTGLTGTAFVAWIWPETGRHRRT